jgi:D-aminopeptidase
VRARELGLSIGELAPGPLDAITDVGGVRVGHATLRDGEDVRTGVTVVVPPELPCFAGAHRLNGNGELTGLEWVRESGLLTSQIGLTNTYSVGVVRDAIVAVRVREGTDLWHLPVVGETYDGFLSDIEGMHVRAEHLEAALTEAAEGPVAEGCVGAGTGTISYGFKGGIGTASRRCGEWTLGVLVQANHGRRRRLMVDGVPVGRELGPERIPAPGAPEGAGSIIVVVATDAPLLPHQCERVAQRAALGIARTGGAGENSSGDLILCFATGNRGLGVGAGSEVVGVSMLPNERIDELFYGAIEATEEAIVNSLLAAETTTGRHGRVVHRLDPDALVEVMRRYGREQPARKP